MAGQNARPSGYRERNSTADKALDILQLFDDTRLVLSGSQVAQELGVARSTAYRYLQSLVASGFLEESPDRPGYRLGTRVLELARLARKGIGLIDVAKPVMRTLAGETGETVLLTRRSGMSVVCLAQEETDHPVRLSYEPGHVLPGNAGASALVPMAWAPSEQVDEFANSGMLERFTEATVRDPAALRERLAVIRMQGFAVSRGELDPDIVGVAAPLRDAAGRVAAAVSVAGLSRRVPEARVPEVVRQVCAAAARISESLALIAT